MKRILLVLTAALVTAAMMAFMAAPAFAAIDVGSGKGNPDTTPSGNCPPGQNQDTSKGGLKKCP